MIRVSGARLHLVLAWHTVALRSSTALSSPNYGIADLIRNRVDDELARSGERINFASLAVQCGSEGPPEAALALVVDGEAHDAKASGDGPVDATFNAIKAIYPHEAHLQLFQAPGPRLHRRADSHHPAPLEGRCSRLP